MVLPYGVMLLSFLFLCRKVAPSNEKRDGIFSFPLTEMRFLARFNHSFHSISVAFYKKGRWLTSSCVPPPFTLRYRASHLASFSHLLLLATGYCFHSTHTYCMTMCALRTHQTHTARSAPRFESVCVHSILTPVYATILVATHGDSRFILQLFNPHIHHSTTQPPWRSVSCSRTPARRRRLR